MSQTLIIATSLRRAFGLLAGLAHLLDHLVQDGASFFILARGDSDVQSFNAGHFLLGHDNLLSAPWSGLRGSAFPFPF
jgi:hypothetical protein